MTDATQTPTLDAVFSGYDTMGLVAHLYGQDLKSGYVELTALKAENTELRAAVLDAVETMKAMDDEISALKSARPKPVRAACGCLGAAHPRKLREVKGVTYEHKKFCVKNGGSNWQFASIALLIAALPHTFTDADHAAIYALKDDPFEPVETVEDVLLGIAERIRDGYAVEVEDAAARVRAARDAETGGGE